MCGKSWQTSGIPPEFTFSHKTSLLVFLHSSISTRLSLPCPHCTLPLSYLTHTHTQAHTVRALILIQYPIARRPEWGQVDCCRPDIKTYLISPHTHARTHLWSVRPSAAMHLLEIIHSQRELSSPSLKLGVQYVKYYLSESDQDSVCDTYLCPVQKQKKNYI